MIFRQLFEPETSTYTYLLGCEASKKAILIDTVAGEAERYAQLLDDLDLRLVYTLETHVHADHITAAGILRDTLHSKSVVHRDAGAMCADLLVTDDVELQIGSIELTVLHTPGHTNGCVSYFCGDRVFTGDALLIGGCGRTDFQQGNAGALYDSITQKIYTLPPDTLIYPGHDYNGHTVSTVKQEIASNPRISANRSRDEFIALMAELQLPYPRFIDQALPANQACGRPNDSDKQLRQG